MKDKKLKRQVCIACRRVLEPVKIQWAAGPVCYPCYWAAKFYYENGYQEFASIPTDFAHMLGDLFTQSGYLWPDDLIQEFKDKHFKRMDVEMRRWWSPKYNCLGSEGIRDPEHPCERFYRGKAEVFLADCETDGHYLCQECACRKLAETSER